MTDTIRINRMPSPTFAHSRVNGQTVRVPEYVSSPAVAIDAPDRMKIALYAGASPDTGISAVGRRWRDLIKGGMTLSAAGDIAEPARLDYSFSGVEDSAASLRIDCREGSSSKVIIYVRAEGSGDYGLRVYARMDVGSKLELVEIFEGEKREKLKTDTAASLRDGCSLILRQICLGGRSTVSGAEVRLRGRGSSFEYGGSCVLGGKEEADINLVCVHEAPMSVSHMDMKSVLGGRSSKTFKGTIDFRCGCSGSSGEESETVLMLSEDAHNRTVPVILCTEEDVQGSHGATIGRLKDEVLYYLESRGLSEEEAVKLMAESGIQSRIRRINDEKTREKTSRTIKRRTEYVING